MRFFTLALWSGEIEDDAAWDRAVADYWQHFEAIRDRLPAALARFHKEVSLHDAQLRSLEHRGSELALRFRLCGDAPDEAPTALRFGGVRRLRMTTGPAVGRGSFPGLGDLGYTELELAGDGFVQSMLFSSGVELEVEATSFEVEPGGQT